MKKIADIYGGLNFGKYFILLPFISTASRTILMHSLNFIKKSCLEIGSCCSSLYGNNNYYYVASSVSGQNASNPALKDGAIMPARDYPLCSARKQCSFSIINPLLTKLVRSRWLDIGLALFLRVYGLRLCLCQQTRKKKRTWPISSHLDLTLGQ